MKQNLKIYVQLAIITGGEADKPRKAGVFQPTAGGLHTYSSSGECWRLQRQLAYMYESMLLKRACCLSFHVQVKPHRYVGAIFGDTPRS